MPLREGSFINLPTMATPTMQTCQKASDYKSAPLPEHTMEQRMIRARVSSGLSIADIARSMSIHPDYYKLMEGNAERVKVQNLMSFCRCTNTTATYILYGNDSPPIIVLQGPSTGQKIRAYRKKLGLSAFNFAVAVFRTETKRSMISAWENEKYMPELRSIMAIARAYGINAVSFFPDEVKS